MNDDAWDDVCVNPHQDHLDKGRQDGLAAGQVAGFDHGRKLGITKGIEYGVELGFTSECCRQLMVQHDQEEKAALEIDRVLNLLEAFPKPAHLFTSSEEANEKVDLQADMQRIRNKFKLLTIRLKKPKMSLKQVLEDQSRTPKETSEW